MPTVLITPEAMREVAGPYVKLLRQAGFEIRYPKNPVFARGNANATETIAELADCDASIASGELYSAEVLKSLPRLRVVARCGVGYDRVDIAAATACGIPVTITPQSNHEAVAEMALALLLGVTKSLVRNDRAVRAGQWPRQLLRPVRGATLGIIGLGRTGSSLAYRAQALGMKVIAHELKPNQEFVRAQEIELITLDALLARSDFVSLHCPLNDETKGLINRRTLSLMKPGAVLINTARGKLVVEADLVAALQSGRLGGAGLDVFEQEPPDISNPLFQLDSVVCAPHLAGNDEASMEGMGNEAARYIVELYRGEWPDNAVVNKELRDGWKWRS